MTILLVSSIQLTFGQIVPPYQNDFDNVPVDTSGWSHYAISGTDDWQLGSPADTYLSSPYSAPNSWVTNLNQNFAANSNRALETPYFNLTNTSLDYVFVFRYKTHSSGSLAGYYVEYTLDHGASWTLLDNPGSEKKNWQTTVGFPVNAYSSFQDAAFNLSFIQGADSVKFRFRCVSGVSTGEGWLIDRFSIAEPHYNLTPQIGTPIIGKNKYFPDFEVESSLSFINQFTSSFLIQSNFYLSNDPIIDGGDLFLGQFNNTLNVSLINWDHTFTMPSNLAAGTYYILYEVDVLDSIVEFDELDNVSYTLLNIDSIFTSPFKDDFDIGFQNWNNTPNTTVTSWSVGDPNSWHAEDAHSGTNAWYTGTNIPGSNNLESPYLDLTLSTNSVLCFWYRTSITSPSLTVHLPWYDQPVVALPYYAYGFPIPAASRYGWDCYCLDLSNYDGEASTRIMINGFGDDSLLIERSVIDDIYVGPALPDARIEGEKLLRFTPADIVNDTLQYTSFNAGLSPLISTNTEFYWSTDSILDVGDIFIGTNIEVPLSDTTFAENSFAYVKPTLIEGNYFIIYISDADDAILEMREENNNGYFQIHQTMPETLPYFNDFETTTVGWSHEATLGTDSWFLGDPQGVFLDSAISGINAFVSSIDGSPTFKSRMHLITPVFDLTELQNPVLEFDLIIETIGSSNYATANILYSINGGSTWLLLDSTNQNNSFKRMYYRVEYYAGGNDQPLPTQYHKILYGFNQPGFVNYSDYQGRDYDNNVHHVVDLTWLNSETEIQFMFVYANAETNTEGLLVDNFKISERTTDLINPLSKNVMADPGDSRVKQNLRIENNSNYISSPTNLKIYCSQDSLLDNSDYLLGDVAIPAIRPYAYFSFNVDFLSPPNYGTYNYLLLEIDNVNLVNELNELNNLSYLALGMDTASHYTYPVLFDFEEEEIDGWVWYHDSTGGMHGQRFRHQKVIGEPALIVQNGEFFLDKPHSGASISQYPVHYLESPPFDFTNKTNIELSFDFWCVGTHSGSTYQGANLQYTTDGGNSWQPLIIGSDFDSNPFNWYTYLYSIHSLGGEPGWTYWAQWNNAQYDLSFLSGQDSVRFRFKVKTNLIPSATSGHGLKVDNFKIEASEMTSLPPITICSGDAAIIFGVSQSEEGVYLDPSNNFVGADTVLTQELIVNESYLIYDYTDICQFESYTFADGSTLDSITSDLIYDSSIPCLSCCDSIIREVVSVISPSPNVVLNLGVLYSAQNGASYQWLDCQNNFSAISGETNQFFTSDSLGNYAVIVNLNGCIDTSDCYNIHALQSLQIEPTQLIAYPNPTSGTLFIQNPGNSSYKCVLVSAEGTQVWSAIINPFELIELNQSIASGIYFLKFSNESITQLIKISIQR